MSESAKEQPIEAGSEPRPNREGLGAIIQATEAVPLLLALVWQYQNDMRHVPTEESRQRRLEVIDAVLKKVQP